jgi:hypothetical protein
MSDLSVINVHCLEGKLCLKVPQQNQTTETKAKQKVYACFVPDYSTTVLVAKMCDVHSTKIRFLCFHPGNTN